MTVEIKKDERKVEFENGKFQLRIEQDQEYDIENVIAMVLQWKEHQEAAMGFLKVDRMEAQKEMEKHLRIQAKNEVDSQFKRAQEELNNVEKALAVWEPALKEWKLLNAEKYAELEVKARENIVKMRQSLNKQ